MYLSIRVGIRLNCEEIIEFNILDKFRTYQYLSIYV